MTPESTPLALSTGVLGVSGYAAVRPAGTLELAPARPLITARNLRAAYEADGSLARDTLRLWGRERVCPDDVPPAVAPGDVYHVIEEEVVWGGFLAPHFGHFLVELVSRLWPLLPGGPLEGRPVVFGTPVSRPWMDEWLTAFGVEVFDTPEPGLVRFTDMHVPEPALRIDDYGAPELCAIHRHARTGLAVPEAERRGLVWLSRTSLPANRRVRDEALVERVLEGRADIVRPETLTLAEQVGVIESAEAVAGVSGSAFHSLFMAERRPPCLQFSTSRIASPFAVQERLLETETVFVPTVAADPAKHDASGRPNPYRVLVPETLRALGALTPGSLLDDPLAEAVAYPERAWSVVEPAPEEEATGVPEPIERALTRVVLDPYDIGGRMVLGTLLEGEGRVDDALEQYAAAAELDPGYVYGRVRAARVLWLAGRKREAATAARRVLELDPANAEVPRYLAAEAG